MTLPMFLVNGNDVDSSEFPSRCGENYVLPRSIFTHAIKSMRLDDSDSLQLTNGHGGRALCHIVDKNAGIVCVDDIQVADKPSIQLGLIQSLATSGRDEQAIEMATEIGVDVVIPWKANRSVVQWKAAKAEKALHKWRNVLISATEQSRRDYIPELKSLMTSKQLVIWAQEKVKSGDIVLILHQDATETWEEFEKIVSHIQADTNWESQSPTIWVVVGPEGGISDEEVESFKNIGSHVCVIGNNILRASSAGPVALALLSRILGRYNVQC